MSEVLARLRYSLALIATSWRLSRYLDAVSVVCHRGQTRGLARSPLLQEEEQSWHLRVEQCIVPVLYQAAKAGSAPPKQLTLLVPLHRWMICYMHSE